LIGDHNTSGPPCTSIGDHKTFGPTWRSIGSTLLGVATSPTTSKTWQNPPENKLIFS
ncbi:unnamed protein product, partial [Lampetra fluviatilis]